MQSAESQIPGFFDVIGPELDAMGRIEAGARDVAVGLGFEEVRTTAVAPRERYLAATKVHPSKIFEVRRAKEGSRYALQADLAIGMARFVARLEGPPPLKLMQLGTLFRDRPASLPGYRREFRQALFAAWGLSSPRADVDVVTAAVEVLRHVPWVSLDHVQVSNQGIFNAAGPDMAGRVRFDPRGLDVLRDVDVSAADIDVLRTLFEVARVPLSALRQTEGQVEHRGIRVELARVRGTGEALARAIPDLEVGFSLSNLRGTGHYSGVSFQVAVTASGRPDAFVVADGGHIGHLPRILGGRAVPGVCMGIGSTVLAQLAGPNQAAARVAVLAEEDGDFEDIVAALRRRGHRCTVLVLPRRRWRSVLKSPLYADHAFVLVEDAQVTIRNADEAAAHRLLADLQQTAPATDS